MNTKKLSTLDISNKIQPKVGKQSASSNCRQSFNNAANNSTLNSAQEDIFMSLGKNQKLCYQIIASLGYPVQLQFSRRNDPGFIFDQHQRLKLIQNTKKTKRFNLKHIAKYLNINVFYAKTVTRRKIVEISDENIKLFENIDKY